MKNKYGKKPSFLSMDSHKLHCKIYKGDNSSLEKSARIEVAKHLEWFRKQAKKAAEMEGRQAVSSYFTS